MGNTRRKFGAEFKREAVRQALQPGNAVATIAQDLGVHESVLRRWLKEYGSGPADKATERPLKNAQTQEIDRLKRELVRVKMERDIIKKALGYFAKDPS
jgi:transposase